MSNKITQIFKNIGKSPSQIHKPNIYAQSLAETKSKGDYERSAAALSPTTYQQANKLNFQFASWYAILYHLVSALLGLATVIMLAFIFSGAGAGAKYPNWLLYGMFGLTFIILCALLFGIEVFKSSLAKGIFKNLVIGAKVRVPNLIALLVVMLFSILVSAIGGAILSYEMNDKSVAITQTYSVKSDSIRKLHDENLEAVNESIKAYKANLNKGDYWAKYATREKLDKAIDKRTNILGSAKNEITWVQAAKEKEVSLNSNEGKNYAMISAITVFVLELLSILAYWFQYVYHANCEREAINFAVLSPTQPVTPTDIINVNHSQGMMPDQEALRKLLQEVINGNQNNLAASPVQPSKKIGFGFTAHTGAGTMINVNRKSQPQTPNMDGNRNCEFCGELYEYKVWNQRFCCEKCRVEAWQVANPDKVKSFKKGGKKHGE